MEYWVARSLARSAALAHLAHSRARGKEGFSMNSTRRLHTFSTHCGDWEGIAKIVYYIICRVWPRNTIRKEMMIEVKELDSMMQFI